MTDTANAPERIWAWPNHSENFSLAPADWRLGCWGIAKIGDDTEYVLATHCDELVAAAEEEAFARGANWAKEKARVEGRLVIVDSPELATLRADLAEAQAKIARLTEALKEIAHQKKTSELDTEYDVECADFEAGYDACIDRARAALQENANG